MPSACIPDDLMRKYLILPLGRKTAGFGWRSTIRSTWRCSTSSASACTRKSAPSLAPASRIKGILDEIVQHHRGQHDRQDDATRRSTSLGSHSTGRWIERWTSRSIARSTSPSTWPASARKTANDPTQAPIIKLVQAMIAEAVRNRARDIHIEPMKDRVRVRYRIDGECVDRDRIPLRMKGPLISRLKIMAGIDIAEKRLPQDGRIKLTVDKQNIDFRVSTLPAYHGESVVLRILRPDSVRIGIQNLGFEEDDYKAVPEDHQAAQRHLPGDRPDRLGKNHDAVRRAERTESPRPQDHHRRGSGRI